MKRSAIAILWFERAGNALDSRWFGAREGLDRTIYAKQGVCGAIHALVRYRRASRGLVVTFG